MIKKLPYIIFLSVLSGSALAEPVQNTLLSNTGVNVPNLDNQEKVVAFIKEKFEGRISGISIEKEPQYKIVVSLVGRESSIDKLTNVQNILKNSLGVEYPIEINYGAKITKENAIKQLEPAEKLLKTIFPKLLSVHYDEVTGEIVAKVPGNESKEIDLAKKAQALWLNSAIPLKIDFVTYVIKPLAYDYGGTPVVKKVPNQFINRYDCTIGYGVKDTIGNKYLTTAAHCLNDPESKLNGTQFKTIKEYPLSAGSDFEILSTPNTIGNQFYSNTNQLTTLTGRRSLGATLKNEEMCHYGNKTGYSCGVVTEVPARLSQYPNATFVYVQNSNTASCAEGDSGGPVFTKKNPSIASGTVSLGALEENNPNICYGYYYIPTDDFYSKGYSFIY